MWIKVNKEQMYEENNFVKQSFIKNVCGDDFKFRVNMLRKFFL